MSPSRPEIISPPHRHVQILVFDLGLGRHVGLEDLDSVVLQKIVNGILGVLEIDELPGAGGAVLATRGGEALGDAVVTEIALIDGLFLRMEVAAAVRAGLDAVAAAE